MGGYQMVFGVSWGHHFLFRPYDLDVSSMISGLLGIVQISGNFDKFVQVIHGFSVQCRDSFKHAHPMCC